MTILTTKWRFERSVILQAIVLGMVFMPFVLAAANSQFSIGPEVSYMKLRIGSNPMLPAVKVHGYPVGFNAFYEYKQPKGIYFNLNGSYIGSHLFGNFNRHFRERRAEFRIGCVYPFACLPKWKFIPYIGFGFGYITQSHIRLPNIAQSVRTQAPTYYVPVGFLLNYAFNDSFQAGLHMRWTPQVDATFKSSLFRNRAELKNKDGYNIELPFAYIYKNPCNYGVESTVISLIPFWRLLRKGSGTGLAGVQEIFIPKQIYHFWGLKLMVGVNF